MHWDEKELEKIYELFKDSDPELGEILARCCCSDPHEEDVARLYEKASEYPEWFSMVFSIISDLQDRLIKKSFPHPILIAGARAEVELMRREMDYENAQVLEKMLIDNLMVCWLHLLSVEFELDMSIDPTQDRIRIAQDRDKRSTTTQIRFLRAVDTFMRYKKLHSK